MPTPSILHLAQTTPGTAPAPSTAPSGESKLTLANPGTAGTTAPGGNSTQQAPSPFGGSGIFIIFVMVGVMILMTTLTGRKEKKKRQTLMDSLGKGDKVITIGGQIGTIDQIRDTEVVLRIDENSNVKARFSKASIQQVLESAGKSGSASDSDASGTIEVKTKGEKVLAAR